MFAHNSKFCSIIVVAFRGSVDSTNIATDLKFRLVGLPDQIIGIDKATFRVTEKAFVIDDNGGWTWNVQLTGSHTVSCFSPSDDTIETGCVPFSSVRKKRGPVATLELGALAILSATPVARNTLPFVHMGFNESYLVIRRKLIENILPVLQRQLSKAKKRSKDREPLVLPKIYCTGHSLGGR